MLALVFLQRPDTGTTLLTEKELQDTIFQTMASATHPPSFSTQVYQIIQP